MSHLSLETLPAGGGFVPIGLTRDGRVDAATPSGADGGRDTWCVIACRGTLLHPGFPAIVAEAGRQRPDIDVLYGDEAVLAQGGRSAEPILKPGFDLSLLVADDYIGTPLAVRAPALRRLGGLRPDADTAAAYDLVLRAAAAGLGIARLTEVLGVHPVSRPRPAVEDRRAALRAWLRAAGDLFEIGDGLVPGTLRLRRRFTEFPDVTLVIPTRQGARTDIPDAVEPMIVMLLDSLPRTDWPLDKLRVIVGDDLGDGSIYIGRSWPFQFRRIIAGRHCIRGFNYAEKMNVLWRAADTEHLVLMNDDIEIVSPEWLQGLLTFSMQDDVGVVGARLLYANGNLQHAGIPGGLFGMCAHAWLGQPADAPTYQNWALVHREWSMLTGAILATRKSLLEFVNGFDERFRLEFNDVDLCLRLRMLGYRNIYTPFAELIHHEKASRGEMQPRASELALFWKRWQAFLEQDPAYHPGLARNSFHIAPTEPTAGWWTRSG
jgi:O-antigen biosynthesis protein